ncbi:MAG: MerR family DNA-binding transcriptional regulator, partial [Limosilactobacillus sp.]
MLVKEGISIGELSRFCDIPKQTLRYFEEKGLIH